ncbi:MAG: TetR-like C-terminal domain-containing protein [Sporomusaceae bacterium]|nr:TetR-like C-terminal domain-containing protein [Sporomusaceae bacterium]
MGAPVGLTFQIIIETAAAIADHTGLETVTLTAVAAKLGVQKPSLYNHIDSLAHLKQSLSIFAVRKMQQRISQAAIGKAKNDAIKAIAREYRTFAHERPGLYSAIVATPNRENKDLQQALQDLMSVIRTVLNGYNLDEDNTTHALRGLRSVMHGFLSLEAAGWFIQKADKEDSYEQMIATFLYGIEALKESR